MEPTALIMFFIAAAIVVTMVVGCSAYLYYGRIWFRAKVKGFPVPLGRMVSMTFRGVSAFRVINAYVDARLAGFDVALEDLESHERARGRVRRVVRGMIAAREEGLELSFGEASVLDLQGKEIPEGANTPT